MVDQLDVTIRGHVAKRGKSCLNGQCCKHVEYVSDLAYLIFEMVGCMYTKSSLGYDDVDSRGLMLSLSLSSGEYLLNPVS